MRLSSEPYSLRRGLGVLGCALLLAATPACDGGLAPPETPPTGTLRGTITYRTPPADWPPADSLNDLRFFALPFLPQDTLDLFRDLSQLVFSEPLARYVTADTFVVADVPARTYVYSGVAQQFSDALLDWQPVGLVPNFVHVRPNDTTTVSILVDFFDRPPFPP